MASQFPHHSEPEAFSAPLPQKWRHRLMAMTFPTASVLGTIGYLEYRHGDGGTTLSTALYLTAQLFLLHAPHFDRSIPWTLDVARWLAAASTGLVLVDAAFHLFHLERFHRRLNRMNRHAIVCGLGQKGVEVIGSLRKRGRAVVAIDKAPSLEVIQRMQRLAVPILTGDATRLEVLREARIELAESMYALGPEDTTNCEIAVRASLLAPRSDITQTCFVHISDTELRGALQMALEADSDNCRRRLHFIDAFDPEALQLLIHTLPLDHEGITAEDPRSVHLVILGFGRMGRTLAVRAAQLGQFANGRRLRISVVDRHADANRAALLFHHPQIESVADLCFHHLEVLSPETRTLLEGWCDDPDALTSLAVCFDNEPLALEIALQLIPLLQGKEVRVAVRLVGQGGLAQLLEQACIQSKGRVCIHPFGMEKALARLANPEDEPLEKFARDLHSAYCELALRQAADKPGGSDSTRCRPELQDWSRLNEELRDSNRQQAAHIHFKLRALRCEAVPQTDPRPPVTEFAADELELLARMEHARWVAERQVAGWRYAETKDIARRLNPNLIPWGELAPEIQEYDRAAARNIPRLLRSVNLKICRQLRCVAKGTN